MRWTWLCWFQWQVRLSVRFRRSPTHHPPTCKRWGGTRQPDDVQFVIAQQRREKKKKKGARDGQNKKSQPRYYLFRRGNGNKRVRGSIQLHMLYPFSRSSSSCVYRCPQDRQSKQNPKTAVSFMTYPVIFVDSNWASSACMIANDSFFVQLFSLTFFFFQGRPSALEFFPLKFYSQ
jgi:hypothetical protein